MFSVAPNILLAPNMTQNAERKHRTQNTNTAHFRSSLPWTPPSPCMPPSQHTPLLATHAPLCHACPPLQCAPLSPCTPSPSAMHTALVNRIADRCKNITFPQLRLRAVMKRGLKNVHIHILNGRQYCKVDRQSWVRTRTSLGMLHSISSFCVHLPRDHKLANGLTKTMVLVNRVLIDRSVNWPCVRRRNLT